MDNSQRDICLAKPEILAKLDESFLSLLGLSYQKLKQPGVNYISYRVRARRIDTIVQDTQGDLKLVTGEPSYLAPEPPVLKTQDRAVANVYASECCAPIAAADIMPVEKKGEEPAEVFEHNQQALKHSLSKLAANQGLKIVFWGDSVTVGGFASSGEHFFTNQFLSLLHKAYPCNQIAYLNLGVSGANSAQLLPSFAKDVLEKKPDLVVVEFVNDYLLPVETLSKSYKSMITRSSVAGVDLILCVPHVVLPGYLKLNTWDEVNNSALPRLLRYLGKTETVAIADVARRFQLMKSVGLRPELMLIDGELHPGNLGHQLYAEEILACFVRHKKG